MSDEAERITRRDLGVNRNGVGAEAVVYEDGDVTIQNDNGTGLVLEAAQLHTLATVLMYDDEVRQVIDRALKLRGTGAQLAEVTE